MITQINKKITQIKKILVIRTDRIGEVLLSTPILTALKEKWPNAKISMMVKPLARELIEDNPDVDEIIEYSEKISGVFRLRKALKTRNFNVAVIVNPKKEFHLAVFLAGIPVRSGFNRKWGFLLTHKVKDLKFLAQKHEVEYNLDLVRMLGIEPKNKRPVLVVSEGGKRFAEGGIAIHPCTSNPKKQWPKEYFAKLGDLFIENGYNAIIIAGAEEARSAKEVIAMMKNKPVDLSGKTTLKELAALLRRCKLLVSNDSGPVHIAAAVGIPVVAIFGGSDPGSKPQRWGPYGEGHIIIEKEKLEDILPEEVFKKIIKEIASPLRGSQRH